MPPAFVQAAPEGANSGVSNITFSFSSNVTNGNTLYLWACWIDATATFTNFTKSSGTATVGSFVTVGSTVTTGNNHCNQGYVPITGTGSLIVSANLSGTITSQITAAGSEYSGITTTSPVDVNAMQSQSSQSGTDAATSGTATTTINGDLIAGFNRDFGGNASLISAGTNYTGRYNGMSSFQQEDFVQSSFASIAATFTYTGGVADPIITGFIAFKPTPTTLSVDEDFWTPPFITPPDSIISVF